MPSLWRTISDNFGEIWNGMFFLEFFPGNFFQRHLSSGPFRTILAKIGTAYFFGIFPVISFNAISLADHFGQFWRKLERHIFLEFLFIF